MVLIPPVNKEVAISLEDTANYVVANGKVRLTKVTIPVVRLALER